MQLRRREFLGQAGATLAAGYVAPAIAAQTANANGRVNIALIGCGGRGRYVARGMVEQGARLAYLCDVHPGRSASTGEFVAGVQKEKPKVTRDLNEVLASDSVDAVIVATPDHWHAPAAIRACRAGKDVYVEKPASHNIWESRQMVRAAQQHKRILQVGTQNRSAPYNLAAREQIRGGKLGKIGMVRVFNMKPGGRFKKGGTEKPPEGLDWDRWLGRAPLHPYSSRLFHGGWHHDWDFCGGDMGNDGIHQIDLALMLMGDPGLPKSVRALGGRYVHRGDDSQVPDVQTVSWDFDNFLMTFELTGYPKYMRKTTGTIRRSDDLPYWTHNATRIEIYGSELMMTLGRHGGGWIVQQSGGKVVEKMYGRVPDAPHYANFLDCVRTREAPNADIAVAHETNVTMHMGNIAHRAGNVALQVDAKNERFDNEDANSLIKPPYRKGYEIPEEA
jgi:predicted dehydrogenase